MSNGYGFMGYPNYSNNGWDGYHYAFRSDMGYPDYNNSGWDGYHYAFRSDMVPTAIRTTWKNKKIRNSDSPNFVLAGGTSWSCDFDFVHNRNGTGVFLPRLEYGTGVFHPELELLVNSNRVDRERYLVNSSRVNRRNNFVNPNRVDRESNLINPNRVNRESNLVDLNRVDQERNLLNPNRVDQESICVTINVLPDELQEVILTSLPLACILGASCVCKKWKQIVHSGKFKINNDLSKPWYFMFRNSDEPVGTIYDPVQRHWYDFVFPFDLKDTWKVATSSGLICFMQENGCSFEINISNPMTRKHRKFEKQLGAQESTYSSLAFSVDQPSHEYTIAIVRSWQVQDSISHWNTSIHIYNSKKHTWLPPFVETLSGWRAGKDSIVFGGGLYIVVTKIGTTTNCNALLSYNIKSLSSNCSLFKTLIPIPFSLTCIRLMNLQNKIVMVGGLGSHDVPEKIGIWMLKGTEWEEVSMVPNNFLKVFGELDDVFASSGAGDLIYIQTFGATSLLVFDMKLNVWKWCQRCHISKKSGLQLFSGFCFEPRLNISP